MNDDQQPSAPRPGADADELASAYLDGELAAADRSLVDADPARRARVAALREARDVLAAPVAPLAPERRDAMLRAALQAFDTAAEPAADHAPGDADLVAAGAARAAPADGAEHDTSGGEAAVVPLEHHRRPRRMLRVLAPAAVAAAAIGAVAFLAREDGPDTAADRPAAVSIATEADTAGDAGELAPAAAQDTAAAQTGGPAAEEAEAPAENADAATAPPDTTAAGAAAGGGDGAAILAALATVPDLGEASTPDDVAALLQRGRQPTTQAETAVAPGDASVAACAGVTGTPVAGVRYRGERALVVETATATLVVVTVDCLVVAEVAAEPGAEP